MFSRRNGRQRAFSGLGGSRDTGTFRGRGLGHVPRAWQEECEGRATIGLAVDLDSTAMELDEGLDQAQPQANPWLAELILSRRVVEGVESGEEGFEEVFLLAGMDPDALVVDPHPDPPGIGLEGLGPDPDRAPV